MLPPLSIQAAGMALHYLFWIGGKREKKVKKKQQKKKKKKEATQKRLTPRGRKESIREKGRD